MSTVADESYDFVHSSHCLEHLNDPYEAFTNWIRICRPGGYIVTTIPEEDMYEQGQWPSTYNGEHKTSWTIGKTESWSPVSNNLLAFLFGFLDQVEVIRVEKVDGAYQYQVPRIDQTAFGISECAIEFIVRKRTAEEIERQGRLFTK